MDICRAAHSSWLLFLVGFVEEKKKHCFFSSFFEVFFFQSLLASVLTCGPQVHINIYIYQGLNLSKSLLRINTVIPQYHNLTLIWEGASLLYLGLTP